MDSYGNVAYKMIFGFLLATAILGMVLAFIMKAMIAKKKRLEAEV